MAIFNKWKRLSDVLSSRGGKKKKTKKETVRQKSESETQIKNG